MAHILRESENARAEQMTNTATPEMREYATRLLGYEAAALPAELAVPVAFRVCEKLRVRLSKLAGAGGFQSLMARALLLAKQRAPSLRAVKVNADGMLSENHHDPRLERPDDEGGLLLVSYLLGLLCAVIGETFTLRFLEEVWPGINFSTLTAEGTGKHESQG